MGEGISKQMLTVCGKPVIVHTLLAFEQAETINEIVVAARKDEIPLYEQFRKDYNLGKLRTVVAGGETRQESAKRAFAVASEKTDFVAVHDGVRCLITPEEIDRVVCAAQISGAATAAIRCHETVKTEKNGLIGETLDREHTWLARTPQVFGTEIYRAALAVAERDGFTATDDCALVEHIDYRIRLIECSPNNLKITTIEDIPIATAILATRKNEVET